MRSTKSTLWSKARLALLAVTLMVAGIGAGNSGPSCLPGPEEPIEEPPVEECLSAAELGIEAEMTFAQANVFDGFYWYPDTATGAATLEYLGSDRLLYVNLAVNGRWALRNVPVLSVEGADRWQGVTYTFDLGVEAGTDVAWLMKDFTLGTCPLQEMPRGGWDAPVGERDVVLFPGAPLVEVLVSGGEGDAPAGGEAGEAHTNADFPNQESDPSACAPTAVSNSLQFLNDTHDLGIDPAELTVQRMKQATNFGDKGAAGTGCWIDPDASRPEGERDAWWQSKDKYMQAHDLPITTRMSETAADAIQALDDDCDVEMETNGHTVAIVGMTRLADGKYSVDIKHDTQQGQAGGTVTETVTLDPATGAITGGTGTGGGFNYLVIECPEEEGE